MNEKLLEQKAEEYANEKCKDCYMCNYSECKNPYKECKKYIERKNGYITGATEETKPLSEHILELQKDKGRMSDELLKWKEDYIALENLKDNELAKAREIIKSLIPYAFDLSEQLFEEELEVYKRAEQFLGDEK